MGIDLEEMIEKIIDNGNLEDMQTLSELLEDTLEELQNYDKECYEEYAMKLYKMAYGSTFTKEMAEEIVSKMRPYGKRWNIEEIRRMQDEFGLDNVSTSSLYIVMNSAYNDFRDLFGDDTEKYIKYSLDFINDEDARPDKVFIYYTQIAE